MNATDTKVSHTPGPWEIGSDAYDSNLAMIHANGRGLAFARLGAENGGQANAKLIAAAPELLALCKRTLRFLSGEEGMLAGDDLAEIAFATDLENAIAKATT
jgi:hypothetical protein